MKIQLLIISITILSTYCFAQISFEKGYYINNNKQKVDCEIKNIDWKNNPTEFKFRLSENAETRKINIELVKEFEVYNFSKYVRSKVNIDRSTNNLDDLSTNSEPIFKEEQLFLKVIVEGKANLYQYEDRNLVRFFFSKGNSNNIQQLVFKNYRLSGDLIGENNRYKQQLFNALKCETIKPKNIKRIGYRKKDLVNLFVRYNQQCNSDSGLVNFVEKQKNDLFNLTIRPRLNSSSLLVQSRSINYNNTDFGNQTGFGFGMETEFIFPFNKNKWSLVLEPTYQYFNAEKELVKSNASNVKVVYKSIELAIGIRYYFYLNNKANLFINGSYIRDFPSNSKIEYNSGVELDISSDTNLGFGIGYKQNDKYSLELRYQTKRGLLGYNFWSSDYTTFSVIFGYSFF